jgi:hypothetical protein
VQVAQEVQEAKVAQEIVSPGSRDSSAEGGGPGSGGRGGDEKRVRHVGVGQAV